MSNGESQKAERSSWAALIGVGEYEHLRPLKYCSDDVHSIATEMQARLGIPEDHILYLSDKTAKKPDHGNIFHFLGEFKAKCDIQPDDLLFFYFSGHGMADEKGRADLLLPRGATPAALKQTSIPLAEIVDSLKDSNCKNIVAFLDACRSPLKGVEAKGSGLGESSREILERQQVATFFSCDPYEQSFEIDDLGHSSFAHCFLTALSDNSIRTIGDLNKFLKSAVPKVNEDYKVRKQLPFLVVAPQERVDLEIFPRRGEAPDGKEALIAKWTEFYMQGQVEEKIYYEGLDIAASQHPTVKEKILLNVMERLCKEEVTVEVFQVQWKGVRKVKLGAPQIHTPGKFNE